MTSFCTTDFKSIPEYLSLCLLRHSRLDKNSTLIAYISLVWELVKAYPFRFWKATEKVWATPPCIPT